MKNQKSEILNEKYGEKYQNHADILADNVQKFRIERGWSVRELSENADIPYDSLQAFLKRKNETCNYSTFVKLCFAFQVEPSELCGISFIDREAAETVKMAIELRPYLRERIRAYTKRIYALFKNSDPNKKTVPLLQPECWNGFLKPSDDVAEQKVYHLEKRIIEETNVAVKIPCNHYYPHFQKGEIMLLGTHRAGLNGETCVVYRGEYMYICKKKIETVGKERKVSFISLIDGHTEMFTDSEVTSRVGYVIGFLNPDDSWGMR